MPIHHAIWKVGANPVRLVTSAMPTEQMLEEMIVRDIGILSPEWMLIGRQEVTGFGGRVDLLAIAPDGSLVLIEIKRDRTPREIIAQALDYASWVEQLEPTKIAQIFERFSDGRSLDEAFRDRFEADLDEESLNQSHQVVIVASALDDSTERIVNYLNESDIAINVVFFQVFEHAGDRLLSRAWLLDPRSTQANVAGVTKGKGEKEPWNGEFYVSFGFRNWDEARRYGYISGGGGSWYSQTLKQLAPGDRVWVKIPKTGYVGVGRVTEAMQPSTEFKIETSEGIRLAMDVLENREWIREQADDPEMAEYFVRISWLDTVPESEAFDEVGLFGNQNTVCKPRVTKWRHTVDRLKSRFPRWDTDEKRS